MSTNHSAVVMLVNDKVKAVSVSYKSTGRGEAPQNYTFKTFEDLAVGDFVTIPTKATHGDSDHGFTVARVEELGVSLDYTGSIDYQWIAGKVDLVGYEDVLALEAEAIAAVKIAEDAKQRKELAENMKAEFGEELEGLAIANRDTLAIAAPVKTVEPAPKAE